MEAELAAARDEAAAVAMASHDAESRLAHNLEAIETREHLVAALAAAADERDRMISELASARRAESEALGREAVMHAAANTLQTERSVMLVEQEQLSVTVVTARSEAERANAAIAEISRGRDQLAEEVTALRGEIAALRATLASTQAANENDAIKVRALANRVDSALGLLKGLVET
jgi:ribosomal protein L29